MTISTLRRPRRSAPILVKRTRAVARVEPGPAGPPGRARADADGRRGDVLLRARPRGGRTGAAPAPRAAEPAVTVPLGCTLAEAERRIVLAALRHHRTRARAARALGIGLRTLYTKLAAWGADGEDAESA